MEGIGALPIPSIFHLSFAETATKIAQRFAGMHMLLHFLEREPFGSRDIAEGVDQTDHAGKTCK